MKKFETFLKACLIAFAVVAGVVCTSVQAVGMALIWDQNQETNVIGYKVYSVNLGLTNVLTVSTNTSSISPLGAGQTYRFFVTAYASDGSESDPSNEVQYTEPSVNTAPSLTAIPVQTVIAGQSNTFTVLAGDTDVPTQTLALSLSANAPAGAAINAATGVFTWQPSLAQAPSTNVFSVIVTDNGTPALSATQSVTVVVQSPIVSTVQPESVALQWDASLETNVVGYKVYSISLGATNVVSVGTNAATIGSVVIGQSYRFFVTAYAADGSESDPSNEVDYPVAVSNTAPTLASIPVQTVIAGQTDTFTVVAGDTDVPTQTLTKTLSGNAPAGAAINASSGVFTWQPTLAQAPSTNAFSVIVTDNGTPSLSATQAVTVIVRSPNTAPTLASIPVQTVIAGQMDTFTVVASDTDVPTQALTKTLSGNAPAGAAINASSGVFTWQPTLAKAPSTNVFSVIVTDNGTPSLSATQSVTVIVRSPNTSPTLASIPVQTVIAGQTDTFTVVASDTDVPTQTLTKTLSGNAPSGAAINASSGVFIWQPTLAQAPSTNVFSVIVTDNGTPSLSATQAVTVIVRSPNTSPTLASIPLQTVIAGQTDTFTVVASDTDVPTQTLTKTLSGNAPVGAAINASSGVFIWQPTLAQAPSTNVFSVIVTDNGAPALSATQSVTVVVQSPNTSPTLAAIPVQTVIAGQTDTFTVVASDSDVPTQTLTKTLGGNVPAGAVINASSGVFTWQPTLAQAPSTNVFSVIVTDNGTPALSATQSVTFVVLSPNTSPTLASIPVQTVIAGQTDTFTVVASDMDVPTQALTKTLSGNVPAGAGINASSGVFTWQPTLAQAPSTNVFAVIVTDNGTPALSATQSVTVVVQSPNTAPSLAPIPVLTVILGETNTFTAVASDTDVPAQMLTLTLGSDAPVGAAMDSTSGVFTWVPSLDVPPGTNVFTIIVTDDGVPSLTATQSVTVIVQAPNTAPKLAVLPSLSVMAGQVVTFTALASDTDVPTQGLVFTLGENAPVGAAIDGSSGVFAWLPSTAQTPSTNVFPVIVTDNGVPSMSATQVVTVVVLPKKYYYLKFGSFTNGTVSFSPKGLGVLGAAYLAGASVTLAATPATGFAARGWVINGRYQSGNPLLISILTNTLATPYFTKALNVVQSQSAGADNTVVSLTEPTVNQSDVYGAASLELVLGGSQQHLQIGGEMGAWAAEGSTDLLNWTVVGYGLTSDSFPVQPTGSYGFYRVRPVPFTPFVGIP